jgi:hypothetical protein
MTKLNYATIKPFEKLTVKSTSKDSYSTLKKELDDAVFDVRQVGEVDFWFDDEFLLKGDTPIPTVIIKNSKKNQITDHDIIICGNVVIASHDQEGNTVSLTERAADQLSNKMFMGNLGIHPVYIYKNF